MSTYKCICIIKGTAQDSSVSRALQARSWTICLRILVTLKVKVKVKFTLEQATKAQGGNGRIVLLFL